VAVPTTRPGRSTIVDIAQVLHEGMGEAEDGLCLALGLVAIDTEYVVHRIDQLVAVATVMAAAMAGARCLGHSGRGRSCAGADGRH
jgi:hypothetical protein